MKISESPVIVEEVFNSTIEAVWNAITKHEQMIKWFFNNIPAFKPEIGFETKFEVKNEDRVFPHLWKIIEVVPNKKIVYNWKYENYPGDSNVIFELFDQGNAVKIKLTTIILEDFSDDIPDKARDFIERTNHACHQLRSLIEDIVKVTRTESEALDLQEISFEFILEKVLSALKPMISQSGIDIKIPEQ